MIFSTDQSVCLGCSGAASQQRTLTPPDTWSWPIWDLHSFKCWDHSFLNLSCLRIFWVSNIPWYFYFALSLLVRILINLNANVMLYFISWVLSPFSIDPGIELYVSGLVMCTLNKFLNLKTHSCSSWGSAMAEYLGYDDIPVETDPNAQATVPCGECGETEDVCSYCLDCPGALCENCKQSHKRRNTTRFHNIVPYDNPAVEDVKSVAAFGKCEEHPENSISIYCKYCRKPCCIHCAAHQNHNTIGIVDKLKHAKCEIEEYVQDHEDTIKKLAGDISETNNEISQEISIATIAEKQLDAVLMDLHKALDMEGNKLREEINNHRDSNLGILRRHIAQRKMIKSHCQRVVHSGREALRSSAPDVLRYETDKPDQTKFESSPKDRLTISLLSGKEDTTALRQMIGSVSTKRQTQPRGSSTRGSVNPLSLVPIRHFGIQIPHSILSSLDFTNEPHVLDDDCVYYKQRIFSKDEWGLYCQLYGIVASQHDWICKTHFIWMLSLY